MTFLSPERAGSSSLQALGNTIYAKPLWILLHMLRVLIILSLIYKTTLHVDGTFSTLGVREEGGVG